MDVSAVPGGGADEVGVIPLLTAADPAVGAWFRVSTVATMRGITVAITLCMDWSIIDWKDVVNTANAMPAG